MQFATKCCKSPLFIFIFYIFQNTVQSHEQAKSAPRDLKTSNEIISKSKHYNNLVDSFRKNWESPMAYLIQRGYIPVDEAKPDKTSRDTIIKMQKEYDNAGKNEGKELCFLKGFAIDNNRRLESEVNKRNNIDINKTPSLKSKNWRRDAVKSCSTTSPSPLNDQAPVTEMKCVKWEPVIVSTIAPVSTTDSHPSSKAVCSQATSSGAVSTTEASSATTTAATCQAPSSVKPDGTHSGDEECEEYYDDVTECYEYEGYEDAKPLPNTTVSKPQTTVNPLNSAPKSLPKCTTPSVVEETDFQVAHFPNYSSQKKQNNPAFILARKIAKNTVNEYLKNNYQPKLRKTDNIAAALEWATRPKRTEEKDLFNNVVMFTPKHQPHPIIWHKYPQPWQPHPLTWHLQNPPYVKMHPGPHPSTSRPPLTGKIRQQLANHPAGRALPQNVFNHFYQDNINLRQEGMSGKFPKLKNKPLSKYSSSFMQEANKNIKFKNSNNKVNFLKAEDYDYYDYNEIPGSDTGYVTLNAVYVMSNKNSKNENPKSISQYDNVEQTRNVAKQQLNPSAQNFDQNHWKKYENNKIVVPKYSNLKDLKKIKSVKENIFHNTGSYGFKQPDLKKHKLFSNLYKPLKYTPQPFFYGNALRKFSNPSNIQSEQNFRESINSENNLRSEFLSPKTYKSDYYSPYIDNTKYNSYKDESLWTPILLDPKTDDRSMYAKYKAKNDPLQHEFWRNIQEGDKNPSIDLFELHKPNPKTYPHDELLNLYKYKNMNKNLEHYFQFDHKKSQPVESTTSKANSNKKKETKKSQNSIKKLKSKDSLMDSANSIIDTAVRNVTAIKNKTNNISSKQRNLIQNDFF